MTSSDNTGSTVADIYSLSHSLILDVRDKCWLDYFSEQEIAEIKNHHAVELPMLPANITTLIDEFACTPRDKLYDKINEVKYAPNTDEYWVQDAYNDCFRLLGSGFFPLHGVTELGIAKRMWSFVDKCFDYSAIRCLRLVRDFTLYEYQLIGLLIVVKNAVRHLLMLLILYVL